jgi:hypothetical protein
MNERDYIVRKREEIYDEMCKVLVMYEEYEDDVSELLYEMLVKIQNNWEAVITAKED